jgi:hypothetical protein
MLVWILCTHPLALAKWHDYVGRREWNGPYSPFHKSPPTSSGVKRPSLPSCQPPAKCAKLDLPDAEVNDQMNRKTASDDLRLEILPDKGLAIITIET